MNLLPSLKKMKLQILMPSQKREQISKHKPLAVQQEKALAEQLKVINLDALILEEYIKQLDNQRFSLDLIKESLQAEIFGQLSKITEEEVWSKDYHNKLKTITQLPEVPPKALQPILQYPCGIPNLATGSCRSRSPFKTIDCKAITPSTPQIAISGNPIARS